MIKFKNATPYGVFVHPTNTKYPRKIVHADINHMYPTIEISALETWHLVEKYLNEYHHKMVNVNLKFVEGHPISIIESSLKALEILKKYVDIKDYGEDNEDFFRYCVIDKQYVSSRSCNVISKEEYELLKEILK